MRWFKRHDWERRMDAEFRFHLDTRRAEFISQGLSPAEADRRARLEFGALELAKDECRDEKPAAWFDHLLRDLRYAARSLRHSPGFALAAIATLALGIGANTAIFQLLDAVRLRTLPVADPQSLATVQLADRTGWRGNQATQYPALTNPLTGTPGLLEFTGNYGGSGVSCNCKTPVHTYWKDWGRLWWAGGRSW